MRKFCWCFNKLNSRPEFVMSCILRKRFLLLFAFGVCILFLSFSHWFCVHFFDPLLLLLLLYRVASNVLCVFCCLLQTQDSCTFNCVPHIHFIIYLRCLNVVLTEFRFCIHRIAHSEIPSLYRSHSETHIILDVYVPLFVSLCLSL